MCVQNNDPVEENQLQLCFKPGVGLRSRSAIKRGNIVTKLKCAVFIFLTLLPMTSFAQKSGSGRALKIDSALYITGGMLSLAVGLPALGLMGIGAFPVGWGIELLVHGGLYAREVNWLKSAHILKNRYKFNRLQIKLAKSTFNGFYDDLIRLYPESELGRDEVMQVMEDVYTNGFRYGLHDDLYEPHVPFEWKFGTGIMGMFNHGILRDYSENINRVIAKEKETERKLEIAEEARAKKNRKTLGG